MTHPLARDFPQFADRINRIQVQREATGCIASNGSSWPTKKRADFHNALCEWHANGKPQEELAALKLMEKESY